MRDENERIYWTSVRGWRGSALNIKITQVEFLTDGDYVEGLTIETDGLKLEFEDSPPEDNTLKRNFKDVYKIEDLIKKA